MKKSIVLELAYSHHIPNHLLIMHPNIGFDLGLMTKTHQVALCTGMEAKEFLQGCTNQGEDIQIDLRNDCPEAQLLLHASYHKSFGDKPKAVLFFDGDHIFIHTV